MKLISPSMKTGMKAPDGMGMVVATADIQNFSKTKHETLFTQKFSSLVAFDEILHRLLFSYMVSADLTFF